jgi:GNAT superfamily N-acetyltransferase
MKIYQAQPHDVDTLLPLYLGYRRFYEVEENASQARDFILKRLQLNESVIFYAEVDGKAVGFTQLYPLFCSLEMKRIWLLYDLFVDESARKLGVAQTLISGRSNWRRRAIRHLLCLVPRQIIPEHKRCMSVMALYGILNFSSITSCCNLPAL